MGTCRYVVALGRAELQVDDSRANGDVARRSTSKDVAEVQMELETI